jgi:hypothetical protein
LKLDLLPIVQLIDFSCVLFGGFYLRSFPRKSGTAVVAVVRRNVFTASRNKPWYMIVASNRRIAGRTGPDSFSSAYRTEFRGKLGGIFDA